MCLYLQDSVSDVMELLKRQEDLEAMILAQSDRFLALQKKKTQVTLQNTKLYFISAHFKHSR